MATPLRAIRIDDDRWSRLMAHARATGTTASETIRDLIDDHLNGENVTDE